MVVPNELSFRIHLTLTQTLLENSLLQIADCLSGHKFISHRDLVMTQSTQMFSVDDAHAALPQLVVGKGFFLFSLTDPLLWLTLNALGPSYPLWPAAFLYYPFHWRHWADASKKGLCRFVYPSWWW